MPTIVYITPDGKRHEVDVENGYSVMEGAINNNIDGIGFVANKYVAWREERYMG